MRLESDELARLKALLRQAVGENGDAVAAVLAFADIEPETRTRNLRYNRLTQYALAPYGVDLSEAVSGGPEKIKPKCARFWTYWSSSLIAMGDMRRLNSGILHNG
ncbi:hypothetical protein JHQ78_01845 [Neisseria meningitidis]|uniref:hypothetical protein n=1 Tax=Neisseria meningitidis TaxID=487 RepID=UPI001EDD1ADA|nr:hypothetical protein [Neisseria meningitidis]MCG3359325.1 hypothetical protein [Neisseria meningitidis]